MVEAETRIKDPSTPGAPKITSKIVVPNSAVSSIIGKGGAQIKLHQETFNCKIQISPRDETLHERVVTIHGDAENVREASTRIYKDIQSDGNLSTHLNVTYNQASSAQSAPGSGQNAYSSSGYSGPSSYGGGLNTLGRGDVSDGVLFSYFRCSLSVRVIE